MALFNQIVDAQRRFLLEMMSKKGVVGVGIGFRDTVEGELTDELGLIALVEQKLPKDALTEDDLVPPEVNGVKTDVREVGIIRAQVNSGPRDSWRPTIPPGVSIGHYLVTAGTFGALVYDKATGTPLILSNNHVLANSNDALLNDPVLQPAPTDGGVRPRDVVANLYRYLTLVYVGDTGPGNQVLIEVDDTPEPTPEPTPSPTPTPSPSPQPDGCASLFISLGNAIAKANQSDTRLTTVQAAAQSFDPIEATTIEAQATIPENTIDAALARPVNAEMFSNAIRHIGAITGTKLATLGMKVRKTGRTTDFTEGTVTVINAVVDVGYTTLAGRQTARFTGQVMTSGMSQGGDSGSLIVASDSQNAVGLLFAGSGTTTLFTPIDLVLNRLKVQFTPPG
jgi:hypothetical protein